MQITDTVREFDGDKQELVLTMVASADDVKASADKFYADLSERELKGFRKGKAPREVLEQSVGGHAKAMGGIAELVINELAVPAIDHEGIIFIEDPDFNVEEQLELGKPFKFSVSGAVPPVMRLADYGPVDIEMPPDEVTESEIDSQLENIREYYHSFETIDDPSYEAKMGDYVMVTLTVTDSGGKVVSGLSAQSRMIGLGEEIMPMSFDEKVVGAKAGDTLEFDFEAINPDGTSDFGDGRLHAVVDVNQIRQKILPQLDDELAAKVGCMDASDMRKQMRRNIEIQKAQELPKLKVNRAIDKLVERVEGDVPEYYVDFIRQDVAREFMKDLEMKGTTLQQWMLQNSVEGDSMREQIDAEAKHRAKIDCALEAIFKEKGMIISDDDIDKMFEGAKDSKDAHSRKEWEEANRLADLMKMARQTKATEWLVKNANVTIVG